MDSTMAHRTFTNLPPERRAEIIAVALAEFTAHDYESASLSKVMDQVGVTRGAFYRYFDGKESLYRYLIDTCLEEKRLFIEKRLDVKAGDFFAVLRHGMECHLAFHLERPEMVAFLLNAHRNGHVRPEEFFLIVDGAKAFSEGVRAAQRSGTLSPDFEAPFLGHLISRLMMDLAPYIKEHCAGDGKHRAGTDPAKVRRVFDQTIRFLKHGLVP
jgi:TetR/AcrR family transcriptional regulator